MAPLWTRLCGNCSMKKGMFLLSIFMYASTYLLITLVPPADKDYMSAYCSVNVSDKKNKTFVHHTHAPIDWVPTPPIVADDNPFANTTVQVLTPEIAIKIRVNKTTMLSPTTTSIFLEQESPVTSVALTTGKTTMKTFTTESTTVEDDILVIMSKLMKFYHLSTKQLAELSTEDLKVLIQGMSAGHEVAEDSGQLGNTKAAGHEAADDTGQSDTRSVDDGHEEYVYDEHADDYVKRSKRYLSLHLKRSISDTIEALRSHVFVLVTAVVLVGELFVAPLTYLGDNLWFWFLEGIDASEHYGHQLLTGLVATALFSMVITATIDSTSCILSFGIDHFMIHFYMFAALLVPVFVLGSLFPTPARNSKPSKKKRLTWKALCVVVKDRVHLLCLASIFVLGALRASVTNFLFWVIEDFGTSEMTYGFALCISSLSSIPILILRKSLIKKVTVVGIVSLSFFIFSVQTVYYSFLWSFWAALPIQVLTGFVEKGFWIGVKSISSFRTTSPAIDREVQLILENVYHGIGFCAGSIMSGWIAEVFGFSILFQCTSVASLVWGLVFIGVWKLVKTRDRKVIRYTKLNLAGDEDEDDDVISDHGFDEDDWLEVALKDDR